MHLWAKHTSKRDPRSAVELLQTRRRRSCFMAFSAALSFFCIFFSTGPMRVIPFVWFEYALLDIRRTRISNYWKQILQENRRYFTFLPNIRTMLFVKLIDRNVFVGVCDKNMWYAIRMFSSCLFEGVPGYTSDTIRRRHYVRCSLLVDSLTFDCVFNYTTQLV